MVKLIRLATLGKSLHQLTADYSTSVSECTLQCPAQDAPAVSSEGSQIEAAADASFYDSEQLAPDGLAICS